MTPGNPNILFNCFKDIELQNVKVVIIGQDPYPQNGVATGTPFGCVKLQPSLEIMLKEIFLSHKLDTYETSTEAVQKFKEFCNNYDISLTNWKKQGVLLLNSSFTCFENRPGSHLTIWREFVANLIREISLSKYDLLNPSSPIIFVLMGRVAQSFDLYINEKINFVLRVAHPAAEVYNNGAKFLGSNVFLKINEHLKKTGQKEIKWT